MRLITLEYLAEDGLAVLKWITSLAMCAALLLPAAPKASEQPGEPSQAAMDFVLGFSDTHLTGMLQRIGAQQPVLVAASQVNAELLVAVFEAEIAQALKVYGPQWQRNLAIAWTPLLTDDELHSLASQGASSPHTEKYLELRGEAGKTMQSLSQDLFKQVLSEVVDKTVKQMGTVEEAPADNDASKSE